MYRWTDWLERSMDKFFPSSRDKQPSIIHVTRKQRILFPSLFWLGKQCKVRLNSLRFNFDVTIIIFMIFNSIDSIKFPTWPLNLISSYEPMKSIFAPRADHMQFSTPPCEVWRLSAFISSSNAQLFIQQYSCGLRVKTDSQTSECSKLHRYGIHQYLIQDRTNT